MNTGRQVVGHPVDVGSGAVFTAKRDFALSGTIPLDWVRHYSTDSIQDTWLGPGWFLPVFMQLEQTVDGLLLTDEVGRLLLFPAVGGQLEPGASIVNFGANMELTRRSDHFEILHWHIATDDIERFVFRASEDGRMPLAWIENLAGHRISVQHDAMRRPVRVVQGLERRTLELSYGEGDLLASVHAVDDLSRRRLLVRYGYDGLRRLVSSVDAVGNRSTYAYDELNRLVAEGNPLGSTFRFQYDDRGRCIYTTGDDKYLERSLHYSSVPPLTRVTDSLGHTTQFLLNPAGQVIQEISPLGATTTTEFDEFGRIVKVTRPDGGVIGYEYDDRGNRQAFVDEAGGRSALEHNDLHLLTAFTDAGGSTWTFEYDERGNSTGLTNPVGGRFECTRDSHGLVVESRRPSGLATSRSYGERLRWVELRDHLSRVLRIEIDELGRETALFDANGLMRRLENDAIGRPITKIDNLGRVTRLQYNGNHDLTERVLPGNVWERWAYDGVGRLIAHENAAGRMAMQYDTEDRLLVVTNRAGERLTRRYDADGRMIAQTLFDGRTEAYEYTAQGFRTTQHKSDGRTVQIKYDKAGNILARTSSDGLQEHFEYDQNARLTRAANTEAEVILERDQLGRVIAEHQNDSHVEYRFDIDNNLVFRGLSGAIHAELVLRYDLRGRLTALLDARGLCQELHWDVGDQLVERQFPGGGLERFSYDEARRVRSHQVASPGSGGVFQRDLEYDERDNVVAYNDYHTGRAELHYDGINRLTEVRRHGETVERYEYDPVGALVRTHRGVRTVAEGGRNLSDGISAYEYDADGCVATIAGPQGVTRLRHNVDGKLTAVRLPDGVEARYSYDPFGRRVSKTVGDERVDFVWHSCDLAAELQNGSATSFFHYHRAPAAQWTGESRQIPIVDEIGLPHVLLDDDGRVVWKAQYESYGLLVSENGGRECPMRFRGQYHDRETDFYYNFHRHYEPGLAAYLAPDPLGLTGGSNFYLYPRNPLLWDDPFGLTCSNAHKGKMGETEMDAHDAALGYNKLGSHDAPGPGGGPARPQGIDGVYHNPNGAPPYIIAEAKYGSAGLGNTSNGQQMSNNWINNPIGGSGPPRLEQAAGPAHAAAIQNSASTNPGSVQRQVFQLPAPGTPGTGSVTQTGNYNPASTSTTF